MGGTLKSGGTGRREEEKDPGLEESLAPAQLDEACVPVTSLNPSSAVN